MGQFPMKFPMKLPRKLVSQGFPINMLFKKFIIKLRVKGFSRQNNQPLKCCGITVASPLKIKPQITVSAEEETHLHILIASAVLACLLGCALFILPYFMWRKRVLIIMKIVHRFQNYEDEGMGSTINHLGGMVHNKKKFVPTFRRKKCNGGGGIRSTPHTDDQRSTLKRKDNQKIKMVLIYQYMYCGWYTKV